MKVLALAITVLIGVDLVADHGAVSAVVVAGLWRFLAAVRDALADSMFSK